MRMRRRKDNEEGSPRWMTTYSDLVTQLLIFFVMLYSFSVIDIQKFQAFLASFQGAGILEQGPSPMQEAVPPTSTISPPEGTELPNPSEITPEQNFFEVYQNVVAFLEESGLSDKVEVEFVERGVLLRIPENLLFETGKADLGPKAVELLDKLTPLFEELPYVISVEGHTDPRPINTVEFPTNWELSTARAARVVRYFTENKGLEPHRFVAIGYGPYHPLVDNNNLENMALNRRVEILINSTTFFE